jgi:TolA-binding protein
LNKKAQDELARLLQRLGHRAEAAQPKRQTAARARPTWAQAKNVTAWQEPTFTQTQTASPTQASRSPAANARPSVHASLPQGTQTSIERKLLEHKAALVVMTVLIALALAIAVIGQVVSSAGVERVATMVGLHTKKIASLEGQQTELMVSTQRRLEAMQVSLAEVKYPPSEFAEAGDLFKAGRYVDAESAYQAFLLRNPNSRLADKALHNAAVAAAMHNNCGMADSYIRQLQLKFPKSPFAVNAKDLGSQCRGLRSLL